MTLVDVRGATITGKGQISISKILRDDISGFEEGSKIAILTYEDRIELRPLSSLKFNEKISSALMSEKSLAKDWNSKKDEKACKNL